MGGGGATGSWDNAAAVPAAGAATVGAATTAPADLGGVPFGGDPVTTAAAADALSSSDPVQSAGLSPSDEALFDQVSQFDEDRGSKDAYDS